MRRSKWSTCCCSLTPYGRSCAAKLRPAPIVVIVRTTMSAAERKCLIVRIDCYLQVQLLDLFCSCRLKDSTRLIGTVIVSIDAQQHSPLFNCFTVEPRFVFGEAKPDQTSGHAACGTSRAQTGKDRDHWARRNQRQSGNNNDPQRH